jgi:NTP pyrophosphatase (non-canonical NTP hydrolase)
MANKLEEYQDFCKKGHKPGCGLSVYALGLGGESGEVLDIIKKALRDEKPVDTKHVKEELGDVYWYLANLCTYFGFSIEEVLDDNMKKLQERYHLK